MKKSNNQQEVQKTYNNKRVIKPISFNTEKENSLLIVANKIKNLGRIVKNFLGTLDQEQIEKINNNESKLVLQDVHTTTNSMNLKDEKLLNITKKSLSVFEQDIALHTGKLPVSIEAIENAIESGEFDLDEYLLSKGKKVVTHQAVVPQQQYDEFNQDVVYSPEYYSN